MDKARELEQQFEKSLEKTEQQVLAGQVDTTDTQARYLGASAPPHSAKRVPYEPH